VINLLLLMLFGVCEYGRLVMVKQLADNAAREGARYAVVNTGSTPPVTTAMVQAYVLNSMNGFTYNATVQVYQADPSTGANVGAWTAAPFGTDIAVQVDLDFPAIVPVTMGILPTTLHVTSRSLMRSEAN